MNKARLTFEKGISPMTFPTALKLSESYTFRVGYAVLSGL